MPKTQIKKWREDAGLKQKWVAEQIPIHVRTLQGWELGRHEPSKSQFARLMRVIGVPESEWHLGMEA